MQAENKIDAESSRRRVIIAFLLALIVIILLFAVWNRVKTQRALNSDFVKAVEIGDIHWVNSLIKEGADPNAKEPKAASNTPRSEHSQEPVAIAALKNGHPNISTLLIEDGAKVNMKDDLGETLLILAARQGYSEMVPFLISKGAEVNVQDKNGDTALTLAASIGRADIVNALLQKGANVNLKNRNGITALIYASAQAHPDIVKLLLAHGADTTVKYASGETALMAATNRRNQDLKTLQDKKLLNDPYHTHALLDSKNCDKVIELLKQAGAKK